MSIQGKFQHYKNVDIDDYFIAVGVPFVARKMMSMSSPLMEISIDGDVYTIKNTSLIKTTETKFKLGEEYDEKMPDATIKSVTTSPSENEILTMSVIPGSEKKCGRHYLFTEDECLVTLTHDDAKLPAKRYYRRVK